MNLNAKTSISSQPSTLLEKYIKICFAVLMYWSVSICMVFLNKSLLKTGSNLNAPVFIIWFQCLQILVYCWICSFVSNKFSNRFVFPSVQFDSELLKKNLPLSVIFCGMIICNNLCLQEVGVAFYTIARSLVTVFSLLFSFFVLGKRPSIAPFLCCCLVLTGFCLGVDQESASFGGLSLSGILYGIAASMFVSLNAIFITKTLPFVDQNKWKLLYYSNFNAFFLLSPLVVIFELNELLSFEHATSSWFWLRMMLSGVFAFAMGYVVTLQIQVTTPLTHTISGVAKACLQTVLAVVYYNESKSALWWFSNLLVITGTSAYSLARSLEMKQKHNLAQSQSDSLVSKKPKEN